ncbi:hypothetical protein ACFWP7_14865 [Streptomyces sp. NPDC058470]|uniref:hypothetical protein n=1 Tax=Streptomyces sp. NPDC058470 TaxID=3346515 RepID=UPI003646FF4E
MIDASNDLYIGLVLLLSVTGVVVTPWLAIRGVVLLVRARRERTTRTVVRGAAVMAWACMAGMYTWGMLHLLMLDESNQALACSERLSSAQVKSVDGYEYSFLPLQFRCRVTGGQTYAAVVPGYVNPVAGILGATAVALTFVVRSQHQHEETKK